jgi:hypothetical protein
MTMEELRKHWGAAPFRPFKLHLDDGREFGIDHPEFLSFSRGGRTIAVADLDGTFEVIDLLHVVSLTIGNGKRPTGTSRK